MLVAEARKAGDLETHLHDTVTSLQAAAQVPVEASASAVGEALRARRCFEALRDGERVGVATRLGEAREAVQELQRRESAMQRQYSRLWAQL